MGPCWNFVGPPNMYTSLLGVLVHFGLLDFYSVDTSFESVLVCPSVLSLLHVRIPAKRADERLYVCLSGPVSTLFSWAPTARVCVRFDTVESLKPAEKIGNLVTLWQKYWELNMKT